jgi:hypothetical protein
MSVATIKGVPQNTAPQITLLIIFLLGVSGVLSAETQHDAQTNGQTKAVHQQPGSDKAAMCRDVWLSLRASALI